MSYPWQIQTLIIEDEPQPTENYREIFKELKEAAPPIFAPSFDEAAKRLASTAIFHLVIIDLGLPQATREDAQPGVEPGIELLLRAGRREDYPIPAVLVISGRLGLAQTHLNELYETLSEEFWYGRMFTKGTEESDAITSAIQKVHEYCAVGIHMRDRGEKLCPTLSPREEDLLRRCVLSQPHCIGLDLEWWGTYHGSSTPTSGAQDSATKILMGQFLLADGYESSRPTFFKFEATETAALSHKDAALMVQKLSHVKLCATKRALNRSLLVTQKVGDSSARPISLAEFLGRPAAEITAAIPQIAVDIADQLTRLGMVSQGRSVINELLWQHHNTGQLREILVRYAGTKGQLAIELLEALKAGGGLFWVQRRSCTHGDLHPTNIALDNAGNVWHAYIFDASGMKADVAVRDLAMLEITCLLHRDIALDEDLLTSCESLYVPGSTIPEEGPKSDIGIHRNFYELICEVRRQALKIDDIQMYALMVFDCAMLQLGGLGVQSRGNKIHNPSEAVCLAELAANWLSPLMAKFHTELGAEPN